LGEHENVVTFLSSFLLMCWWIQSAFHQGCSTTQLYSRTSSYCCQHMFSYKMYPVKVRCWVSC